MSIAVQCKNLSRRQKSQQHLLIFDSVDRSVLLQHVLYEGRQTAQKDEDGMMSIYDFQLPIPSTDGLLF